MQIGKATSCISQDLGCRDPKPNFESGGVAQEVYGKLEEPDGLAGLLRLRTGGPRLQDQARARLCIIQPPKAVEGFWQAPASDSLHDAVGRSSCCYVCVKSQSQSCS